MSALNQSILYAIGAMICYGFTDFIYKQGANAGIRAEHFLMVQGWCFLPLVILYALATHSLVLDPTALWGSLAGAFGLHRLLLFHPQPDDWIGQHQRVDIPPEFYRHRDAGGCPAWRVVDAQQDRRTRARVTCDMASGGCRSYFRPQARRDRKSVV